MSSPDPFRELQPTKDNIGNTRAPRPWWRTPEIPEIKKAETEDDAGVVAEPVGRWLTEEETPSDIGNLRDSRSGSSAFSTADRRSFIGPLAGAVVGALLVLLWQVGVFGFLGGSDPDVQAALSEAGISSITASVDGETAILSGLAESESDIDAARVAALSVDGIAQVRSDVRIVGAEPPSSIASSTETAAQAALTTAGIDGVTVQVSGEMAVMRGFVPDDATIDAAAAAVPSVDGVTQLDNRLVVGTAPAPTFASDAAAQALAAAGLGQVTVTVNNGVAVLTGSVDSETEKSSAAQAVAGLDGVDQVDNQIEIVAGLPPVVAETTPPPVDTSALQAEAAQALAAAGFDTVNVTMDGSTAMLGGTVPVFAIGTGFFEFTRAAESAVLAVPGIEAVRTRLTLRGDGAALRTDLKTLIEDSPIVFESASAQLSEQSLPVLDQAAAIINSQPGLTVLIAGHTDTAGSNETNEVLARGRAEAVMFYLLSRGVPPYRLAVVSYGELFPGQAASDAENRRIEFEVGP